MMDGVPIPRPTTLNFSSFEPKGSTSIPNAYLDSRLHISHGGEQMMTNAKMLQNQFRNMVIVAFHYASTSEIWDVFLMGKVEINNEWKKKIKINNFKAIRDLGVILEEEFITHVKNILDL
jgi:hypothetical protein